MKPPGPACVDEVALAPMKPVRTGLWFWCAVVLAGVCHGAAIAWPWGVSDAAWSLGGDTAVAPAPLSLWEWRVWGQLLWPQAGQPWPWGQVLALAVAVWAVLHAPHRRCAAWVGQVFATASLSATFWWLFISMHTYGGLAAPLAVLAVLALAMALALYTALIFYIFKHLSLDNKGFNAIIFSALWCLAEWARGVVFTGFPWGASGYAHVDALAWAAPWVGVYGMGAVAAWVAAGLGGLAQEAHQQTHQQAHQQAHPAPHRAVSAGAGAAPTTRLMRWGQGWGRLAWATAAVMWGLAAGLVVASQRNGSAHTVAHGPVLPLVLLQGNIAQDEKFQASTGLPQALAWYGQRLAGRLDVGQAAAGHLIVAPETALPLLPQQLGPAFWQPVLNGITTHGHAVLTGLPLGSAAQGYANAAWGITPEMAVAGQAHLVADGSPAGLPVHRYDKHHLVPFGEFIPPLFRWFVDLMHIPLGDFNRGALGQTPLLWGGQRIAPHICYEDLFGEELARGFVADPNTAPTVLLNISNLGWFGNTVALNQHLHISRLRARELGRPVVRATNTGATVVINAQGHITHALPRLSRGELHAQVQGHTGLTPYAEWVGRWGLWPWPILSALILVGAARARRAQSQRG